MLSNPLVTYANTYGFTILDGCAYGTIEGFLVSVSNNTGYKKTAFINFFTPETEIGDAMFKLRLSDEIKALGLTAISDYEVLINGVSFTTEDDLNKFDEAILSLCQLFKKENLLSAPVCSECGYEIPNDEPANYSIIKNCALYTCENCTDDYKKKYPQNTAEATKNKSKGIIGALIGAFLSFAIIASLYIFVFPAEGLKFGSDSSDRVSSLLLELPLSAVIAVLSFLFYRLFTKRKGAERILPCFVISVIFTVLSLYSSSAIIYTNSFELSLNQSARMFSTIALSPFTDPYLRTDFIRYGLYSLACVIAVTLIYSIIFDVKKAPSVEFIPTNDDGFNDAEESESVLEEASKTIDEE